jgi:hypothetical protein
MKNALYLGGGLFCFVLAGFLGFLGLVFVAGAQGQSMRVVVGVILMIAALAIVALCVGGAIYVKRMRPQETTLIQKIDLSGDVSLQKLRCRSCGGTLSDQSMRVEAGAVLVNCEYCGASYQLEETVKW